MLTPSDLQSIARQMLEAQSQVRQIPPFSTRVNGFDLESAYAVGQLIHEARIADGAVPVGRKIGFTNPDMWSLYGVNEPIWAHVYDTTVVRLPPTGARCRIDAFTEPKIEPEIVFHFHSAPPVAATIDDIVASIDWVAHAFEIVQSHFPHWRFAAADTVADWALHGTLLLGTPVPIHQFTDDLAAQLQSFSLTLACNGEVRAVGQGANVLGSPLAALAHLIAVLAKQPEHCRLRANEIVTTGTITTAQPIQAGETWRTVLTGVPLPALEVSCVR
jgi:2-oxo-3-hexenedioate decarboxylase